MALKSKNKEYDLFNKLSEEWWDENGKFRVLHQIRPIRIDYILTQLKVFKQKNLDILDLGCGGGLVSESLCKVGFNVTGIDFVKNNIEVAKIHAAKKNLKINYIHTDIEKMNLKNKFDVIIMFEILEHLDDWKEFLSKINKNLKKNGVVIISTINRNIISKITAIRIAEDFLGWIPKGTHQYEKFVKPEEIEKLMKINKFFLKDIKGLIFNPIDFEWMLSSNTKVNYFCTYFKI